MTEVSATLDNLKDVAWRSLSNLRLIHQMDPCVSSLKQISMASATWYMVIDLAKAFFSVLIRKEDQKQHSHGTSNIYLLLQPIYLVT